MEIIKSINTKQEDIINDILKLHSLNGEIDIDLTYSTGNFYKNGVVKEPILKLDLYPQKEGVISSDSCNITQPDNSVSTIIFDPPFVIAGKTYKDNIQGSSRIAKRFGAYSSYNQLKTHYYNTLVEAYRVLKPNGILIFKLQNTISSGKQHYTHYFVMKSAMEIGFSVKDEFILQAKSKMTSFGGRWTNQIHAMKYHSFFLVLQKSKNKVSYDKE